MAEEKSKNSMKKLNNMPIGDVGSQRFSVNVDSTLEYLPALQGPAGASSYMKMSLQDDQIGMILNIYKNPIKSANWSFPKSDDITPQEELAIDVLTSYYSKSKGNSLDDLLVQIISCIEYGFSAFELLWKTRPYENNIYFVPVLAQRFQPSIENIYVDRGYVEQTTKDKGLVEIPLEDMVFFSLNRQGNDLRGKSVIRNCYQNWIDKNRYKIFQGIGVQRSQTGIPWMEVPEGTNTDDEDYQACETLLKNISTHENAYMITKKGFEFDIKTFKNDPSKTQDIITKLDEKNAISVLAQFVLLGTNGGGGAYALSRDQSDMFLDGLLYIVSYIENKFAAEIISKFIELNFGNTVNPEKVRLRGLNLNKKAGKELAETLTSLSTSGFIKATLNDEIQMRKYLEMPDLSDEELENRKKEVEAVVTPTKIPVKLSEVTPTQRDKTIDLEKKQLKDVMTANLLLIKDKMIADISTVLNRGKVEIKGLRAIEVSYSKYTKNLERKLAGIANIGWESGKKQVKGNNIKLSESIDVSKLDSATLREYVKNEAALIAEDQAVSMKSVAIATATSSNLKGYSNNQTISNVEKVVEKFIGSSKINVGADLMVVGGLNFGEMEVFKGVEEQLWGYEFIAVDDDATTDICSWYSGKTFSVDSTELVMATPPLHPNCRSYLTPIYKKTSKGKAKDKPAIDDVVAPPSIMNQKSVY